MPDTSRKELLHLAYNKANEHGRLNHPEHEVGDLQDALRITFRHVPDENLPALEEELTSYFQS